MKTKLVKYGYGIVTQDGEPWMSEMCVCEDKVPLLDEVQEHNDWRVNDWRVSEREPKLRVVALYRRVAK